MEDKEFKKIQKLLRENLDYSKLILEETQKTNKYLLTARILGIAKLIIIIVPLIVALIYLPAFLKEYFDTYWQILEQFKAL